MTKQIYTFTPLKAKHGNSLYIILMQQNRKIGLLETRIFADDHDDSDKTPRPGVANL